MEAVVADPYLRDLLGAPQDVEDEDGWRFVPPPGVHQVEITCPSVLDCPEYEYYTSKWMQLTQELGPLGDSMGEGIMRTVLMDRGRGRQRVGVCSDTVAFEIEAGRAGQIRHLLHMPMGLAQVLYSQERLASDSETLLDGRFAHQQSVEHIRREQESVLQWSQRNGAPLYFGRCDQIETMAGLIFGDSVRSVTVQGLTNPALVTREREEEEREELVAVVSTSVEVAPPPLPSAPASSSFNPLGVAHDAYCNSNAVLGTVSNASGGLVSGIRVIYQDQFGNRQESRTNDGGSFRFSMLSTEPHEIYIFLVGPGGDMISSTAVVPHMQGGPTDQPCKYVIWRGVD
jgi:hypothetical protein